MTKFSVKELGPKTWPDFQKSFEEHPPAWSGCWCTGFHLKPDEEDMKAAERKELKERLVMADRSHAALVYDGNDVVGWCQFGPPSELPARMRGYGELGVGMPDWRITCFVTGRDRRKEGIARAGLEGALRFIAAKGGGTVDGYPIDPRGKPYASAFLWSGVKSMFTDEGFSQIGRLGSSKVVMRKLVRRRAESNRRPA
jgi:hypothetical protein